MLMRVVVASALVVALGGGPGMGVGAAWANDGDDRRAKTLFAAGKYEDAIEILARLYAESGNPVYLRNIGRCYQRMLQTDKAIASFEEYLLRARDLTAAERDEVRGFIRELEARSKQARADAAKSSPPIVPAPPARPLAAPPSPTPPPASLSPAPPIVAPLVERPAPAPADEPTGRDGGRTLRLVGYGLGAAALAAGIGGGLTLGSSWSRYDRARGEGCGTAIPCTRSAEVVRTRNTVAKVLFIGAAGLGVAGATIFVLGLGGDGGVSGAHVALSIGGKL